MTRSSKAETINLHGCHTHDVRKAQLDPTGTGDLRSRLRNVLDRRWQTLRKLATRAIVDDDMLGLGSPVRPGNVGRDPVTTFQDWLQGAADRIILADNGQWLALYTDQGAAKGRQGAAGRLSDRGVGGTSPSEITHQQASGAAGDLQGIVGAVVQQATQTVASGIQDGLRPRTIAGQVADRLNKIGVTRSRTMADHVVVKAYTQASLSVFRDAGITHVGTIPERLQRPPLDVLFMADKRKKKNKTEEELVEVLTAGDDNVCEECQDISEEGPYPIDEAENLIPAHPNCRCVFVPWEDNRFANVRE